MGFSFYSRVQMGRAWSRNLGFGTLAMIFHLVWTQGHCELFQNETATTVGSSKKCRSWLGECETLSVCPDSVFHLELSSSSVECLMQGEEQDLIQRVIRVPLTCNKKSRRLGGKLRSLGKYCYFQVDGTYHSPFSYCLKSPEEAIVCSEAQVIRKCCSLHQILDESTQTCVTSSDMLYLPQVDVEDNNNATQQFYPNISTVAEPLSFRVVPFHERVAVAQNPSSNIGNSSRFHITRSSVMYSPSTGVFLRGEFQPLSGDYCLERMRTSGRNGTWSRVLFYDNLLEVEAHWYATVVGIMWICLIPFDMAVALVYVVILQRTLHGILIASYLTAGSLVNLFAAFVNFEVTEGTGKGGCSPLDIFQKFVYLSTLTWMTMINIEMWLTFRKLHATAHEALWSKYWIYFLVANSFPSVVVAVSWFIGDYFREPDTPACVLYLLPSLLTFSTPIVLLITLNLILFLRTTWNIKSHQRSTKTILRTRRSHFVDRSRKSFKLFGKLFLMTGPIWLVRVALIFCHLKQLYLSMWGVALELLFSLPNLVFFALVFLAPETLRRIQRVILRLGRNGAGRFSSTSGGGNERPSASKHSSSLQFSSELSSISGNFERVRSPNSLT